MAKDAPSRPLLLRLFLSPCLPAVLLAAFVIWFALWAIGPRHPRDFLVEHVMTLLAVIVLVTTRRVFRFSNLSYTLLFLFLCLHVVGAHYTYGEVPYRDWCERAAALLGVHGFDVDAALGFTRNQYDRAVHFSFGLLCAYPIRELFLRVAVVKGFWGYALPLDLTISLSTIYELLEWFIVVVSDDELRVTYVGTQGDPWDAHKDVSMAALGALLAMLTNALINWHYKRDFAREFTDSLRVKRTQPLGEVEIAKVLDHAAREGS
jgi:putative membrane protein